jgi:hypothetical protein
MSKGFYISTVNSSYVDDITEDVECMMEDIQQTFPVIIPTWAISSENIKFPMIFSKNIDDHEMIRNSVLEFVTKRSALFDNVSASPIMEDVKI